MFTKEQKKAINQRLKENKVGSGKGKVFNLINEVNLGFANKEDVEVLLDRLIAETIAMQPDQVELRDTALKFFIAGRRLIAQNAIDDMTSYMRLLHVVAGALMADGHRVAPNAAPVGSVIITLANIVLPEAVGADISCSVFLTVFNQVVTKEWFEINLPSLAHVLKRYSYFGQEMADVELRELINNHAFYKEGLELKSKVGRDLYQSIVGIAGNQFASSGDGNHFAEWCMVKKTNSDVYHLGLMTHFGSRNVGARIANTFTKEAYKISELPKGIKGIPLDLDTDLGSDYWDLMEWAGEFAEAGHRELHKWLIGKLAERVAVKTNVRDSVYSRHNFAWKEQGGIVHRKGATPAGQGVRGIIPATMGHASRMVVGLGNSDYLESASHGAGRTHSRGQALQAFKGDTHAYVDKHYGIHLIGGDSDEDPRIYKDIDEVMAEQVYSVFQEGTIQPMVVRMAEPYIPPWRK